MEHFIVMVILPFISFLLILSIVLLCLSIKSNSEKEKCISNLKVDLNLIRRKLVDALEQKTRANDYAKDCEKKCHTYSFLLDRKDVEIKKIKDINSIQSKCLLKIISELEEVINNNIKNKKRNEDKRRSKK